ncbi:MAG: hypothetical protein ACE5KQ_06770 [Thermoplasmata archaeon]
MGPEEALGEDALSHLRPTLPDSFKSVALVFLGMPSGKATRRLEEAERRRRDAIREAIRRREQSPAESLRALAAHNEALLKLRKG